ncbi:MAG: histidine phosphatase family protein [Pelobium sp.]
MKRMFSILLLLLALNIQSFAQKATKIWVVRHGEKETSDPKNLDPALTAIGNQRANALKALLSKEKISYIFSTPYNRTKQTALPTANNRLVEVQTYNGANSNAFAEKIKALPAGKNILIVAHSNTVLPIVKALGAETDLKNLSEDDYDFIFELRIKGEKVKLKVHRYGASNHTTEI